MEEDKQQNIENQENINSISDNPVQPAAGPQTEEPKREETSTDNEPDRCRCEHDKCKCKCGAVHWVVDGVLAIAVIVLFVLHFTGNKEETLPPVVPNKPGTGEIVYVNMDSINKNYEMVKLLTDNLDAEKQKQTVIFQNRQKALETKYANFQQNMQSGQLNQKQAEYAQMSIQQESEQIQSDYQKVTEDLQTRYTAALQQVADSLAVASKRINAKRNASFIFSYQYAGQLLYVDPTKDVTREVLNELNKSFKKSKKDK